MLGEEKEIEIVEKSDFGLADHMRAYIDSSIVAEKTKNLQFGQVTFEIREGKPYMVKIVESVLLKNVLEEKKDALLG